MENFKNTNETINVLEKSSETGDDLKEQLNEEAKAQLAAEKAAQDQELKNADQQKASEEIERTRKSIFGKIGEIFKGKEKTEEEKYEDDMKELEKTIRSLTHTSSTTLELGVSFGGGINKSGIKSESLKNKLDEILEINKKIQKIEKGKEKVDLLYEKKRLINELAKIGREEIKNKYSIAA